MSNSITINALFEHHKDRLDLKWLAGRSGGDARLSRESGGKDTADPMFIGHLNFVHPNLIQVLGPSEIDYLASLDGKKAKEILARLKDSQPLAIMISDGLAAPDSITELAMSEDLPLLSSSVNERELINHIIYYLNNALAESITIHGVYLSVSGIGVLLTGESGIGKSELALELLSRGSRLIADDATQFSRTGPDTIKGTCPPALQDFLEVRGLGILSIRSLFGDSAVKQAKILRLVVELKPMSEIDPEKLDRLKGQTDFETILGVKIPKVMIPVAPGRNLAVIIESAARNQILIEKGYDATSAFIKQQRDIMEDASK